MRGFAVIIFSGAKETLINALPPSALPILRSQRQALN
jgi:hypothetical protein